MTSLATMKPYEGQHCFIVLSSKTEQTGGGLLSGGGKKIEV
jgi:hypothetical protein